MYARCHLYNDREVAKSTATVDAAIGALDRFRVTTNCDCVLHFCQACGRVTEFSIKIEWQDPRT